MRSASKVVLLVTLVLIAGSFGVAGSPYPEPDDHSTINQEEFFLILEPADLQGVTGVEAVERLKTQAESTQEPIIDQLSTREGITVERTFWLTNAILVSIDVDRFNPLELKDVTGVTEVTPHATLEVRHTPQTAIVSPSGNGDSTWGLEKVNAPDVWRDFQTQGEGTLVAVLDTGVDADHPDITVDHWRDFSDDPSSEPKDYDWHGTHVAGTIVGGDASGTYIGVAPGASLAAGAVLTECENSNCEGDTGDLIEAMEWSIDLGVDVISLSLGTDEYAEELIDPVRNANAAGSIVVAAIGNDGDGSSDSPGNIYDAISVGAVNENDDVTSFSGGETIVTDEAWGGDAPADWPDEYVVPFMTAPGVSVKSAEPGGEYRTASGTSMATPHVSGAILLAQSATESTLSAANIREALSETAWKPTGEPEEQDTRYGHGIVDAYTLVDYISDRGAIAGTVTDHVTGAAIAGATVIIENQEEWQVSTDADGRFEQDGLPADETYTVTATASGYTTSSEHATVQSDETVEVNLAIAGDAAIDIEPTDVFDEEITEAEVTVTGSLGTYPVERESDGWVAHDVPSGDSYRVSVTAPGFDDESSDVTVASSGTTTTKISLTGDASVEVMAIDVITDSPIEEAEVTVERATGVSINVGATDAGGRLGIPLPGTGETYTIGIEADGYDEVEETVSLDSGEVIARQMTMSGDGAVAVTVVDDKFGVPLNDATVTVSGSPGTHPTDHQEDGEYLAPAVRSGEHYTVLVEAEGYVSHEFEVVVDPDETRLANVRLEGDAELNLHTTDASTGATIADATVMIEPEMGGSETLSTDADGDASTVLPGESSYTVLVDAEGYETETDTVSIASEERSSQLIELVGDATLVVDATDIHFDEPVQEISIEIVGEQGQYVGTADGIEGVPSLGDYNMTVRANGYHTQFLDFSIDSAGEKLTPVSLRGNATLEVKVNGSVGIPNATIEITRDGGASFTVDELTDTDGRVDVAIPGTGEAYNVTASADGYIANTTRTEGVDSGDVRQVELTLAPVQDVSLLGMVIVGTPVLVAALILLGLGYWLRRQGI